jgi:hypothetical protein
MVFDLDSLNTTLSDSFLQGVLCMEAFVDLVGASTRTNHF